MCSLEELLWPTVKRDWFMNVELGIMQLTVLWSVYAVEKVEAS